MNITKPLDQPLKGEQVVGAAPPLAPLVDAGWQRRLNLFSGRSLSDTALTLEQEGRAGRLAMSGRALSHGVVTGLEVKAELEPSAWPLGVGVLTWYLHVNAGTGLTAHGEDVVIRENLRVGLDDLHVILELPPEAAPAGGAAAAEEKPKRRLGRGKKAEAAAPPVVLRRQLLPQEVPVSADYGGVAVAQNPAAALRRPRPAMNPDPKPWSEVRKVGAPRAAILLVRPVTAEIVGRPDPDDPCELDPANEAYADWQQADAAQLILYSFPWEERVDTVPEATWRNRLAYEVFSAQACLAPGEVLPWEEVGVPVALIGFSEDGAPLWVDGYAVVRDGGRPHRRTSLFAGVGDAYLWQARLKQFAEQVAEVDWETARADEEFARFQNLPPAGLLPRSSVDLEAGTTSVFPSDYVVEAVPVPMEQLDAAIEASAALEPFDRAVPDRVRVLVPVPHALYEPRLLQTEEPDPQFRTEIDELVRRRAELVGRREEVRRAVESVIGATTGDPPVFSRPEDDPERLEDEAAVQRMLPALKGSQSRQSALRRGPHQHGFTHDPPIPVGGGDVLFAWVHVDPLNPPAQLWVRWVEAGKKGVARTAFWGDAAPPEEGAKWIGALPVPGEWTRLEVPGHTLGLEGASIGAVHFGMRDGRATWDRWGRFPSTDEVWVDDDVPKGVTLKGETTEWVKARPEPFSGTQSRTTRVGQGAHDHTLGGFAPPLAVERGDVLYAYVWLDPQTPPRQVMLSWFDGSWEHRAYWGEDRIPFGVDGTPSRRRIGDLPRPGQWTRLEVPAALVGLEGRQVTELGFALFDGRAAWDRTGRRRPTGTGLWGEYYGTTDFRDLRVARLDPVVDFDWGTGRPDPRVGSDTYSVRWSGWLVPPADDEYTLTAVVDDGCRVWLDGELVIDDWNNGNAREVSHKRRLEGGRRYELRVEYVEFGGGAQMRLQWSTPAQRRTAIPQTALFPPDALAAEGLVRLSEQSWWGTRMAAGELPNAEDWQWVSSPALDPPEQDFGTRVDEVTGRRLAAPLAELRTSLDDSGLFSAEELDRMEREGVRPFATRLEAAVRRADDYIDFSFARVQTDMYRLRKLMLGKQGAQRLATSPALASIIQDESALRQRERLMDYLEGVRAERAEPEKAPVDSPRQPVPVESGRQPSTAGPPSASPRTDPGGGFLMPNLFARPQVKLAPVAEFTLSPAALRLAQPEAATFAAARLAPTATLPTGIIPTRTADLRAGEEIFRATPVKPVLRKPVQHEGVEKVLFSKPLIGEAYDFRSVTIAERMQTPAANEAKSFAVLTRFEVLNGLKGVQEAVEREHGLHLRFEDVLFPGFPRTTDEGNAVRKLRVLAEPAATGKAAVFRNFEIPVRTSRRFGDVKEALENVLEENDPADGDESAFFSMAVELLDATTAGLRNVEGKVQQYREALRRCEGAAEQLVGHARAADRRLKELADELAEVRHDVAVARALYRDELDRVRAVNERRALVLRDHVQFFAFQRPRLASAQLDAPVRPLDPAFTQSPVPVALADTSASPPELRGVVELLREAPLRFFHVGPSLLDGLDNVPVLLGTLGSARGRAQVKMAPWLVESMEERFTGKLGGAIERTLAAQRQVIGLYRDRTAQMDLSGLHWLNWSALRERALDHLSLGDVIDAAHGRTGVDRRGARELDDTLRIATALHRALGQVKPALRLDWAEALSQYDQAADLRDLFALPRFGEVELVARREMQALVDWLFGRVRRDQPAAWALMSDVVRVCVLLASHAPVNQVVAAQVQRETEARVGGTIEITADPAQVRVGMHVLMYDVSKQPVHAVVEDLAPGVAVTRVVHASSPSVTIARDTRAELGDQARRATQAAAQTAHAASGAAGKPAGGVESAMRRFGGGLLK
jgi:hypothetical protein